MNGLARGPVSLDCVEMKTASPAQTELFLKSLQSGPMAYVEFAPGSATEFLTVLARFGARAKIRTGGVTAEAFPSAEMVAEFLAACAREQVAFKATAGLHHAVRGAYRLTYERESALATMHGFVNVFLAAVLAYRGVEVRALIATVEEKDASAFVFGQHNVRWLGFEAGVDEIEAVRREFAISYGSCSFSEPVEEAKANGWL